MTTISDSMSGVVMNKYIVYGQGLIYEEGNNSNLLIHHYDQVGSTTALTDGLGTLREAYEYSPYGEIHSGDTSLTEFLYNGRYGVTTDSNGLYYMRARYYNPTILRFINQDVVLGTLPDILSLNRYAYCEGNPVSFIDPFGLCHEDTAKMHDVAGYINIVAAVLSVIGLPVIGEPLAIIVNSFDIGLYLYDIRMDVECNVESDVLRSDICKMILDGLGIVTGGIAKSASYFIDKTWKLGESGETIINLNKIYRYDKIGKNSKLISKWSNRASIADFIAEKVLEYIDDIKSVMKEIFYE